VDCEELFWLVAVELLDAVLLCVAPLLPDEATEIGAFTLIGAVCVVLAFESLFWLTEFEPLCDWSDDEPP
jgi:hypothetical protein